ncbi:MAG: glycosyltransferase [Candidatus Levyibacteriota bacterium]
MKIVIIIPTYNEKGNIDRLIPILEEEIFPQIKNHDMNILIADDNSPDQTAEDVKKLMKKYKNLDLIQGEKYGLGAAYVRAMTYAVEKMGAEIMFEMDADLSHNPKKIPDFLKKIDEGYDFVIGTRYSDGGSIPSNWGLHRKAFSVLGNLIVRCVLMKFSIHDWTGGFRAIRKEVFLKEKDELTAFRGYTFQVSFLHKTARDGFKIAEVPIAFTDRTLGKSKIVASEYIVDLLKYIFSTKINEIIYGSFGKFLVVGGIGFILQAVILKTMVEGMHISPTISNLAGAVVAIFSNFNLNNLWTFNKERVTEISKYLWKLLSFYATSATGVIFLQTGTIYLGEIFFGRKYYFLYFLVGTAILLVWNFSMYRFVIWRKKPHK